MPSFVRLPMVSGKSAIVVSPAPPKAILRVVESLLEMPDVTVSRPASLPMRASPLNFIPPLRVLLPETLPSAPCPDPPLPLSVIGSAIVLPPAMARVPPLLTTVPAVVAPKAVSLLATRVPTLMVVTPV